VTLQEFNFCGPKIHVGWLTRTILGHSIVDYRADYRALYVIIYLSRCHLKNRQSDTITLERLIEIGYKHCIVYLTL